MDNQDLIDKYPTLEDIAEFRKHHHYQRPNRRLESTLPECPTGQCKLIDNEFVELCETCEQAESEHYKEMKK